MKAKIAVATVSGKAYYLIVSELKKKNVPFLSLTPNERIPMEVKVGDTVVYAKYSGTTFKTEDGKDILFMKESDILAILA